jgi:hypothetical protein
MKYLCIDMCDSPVITVRIYILQMYNFMNRTLTAYANPLHGFCLSETMAHYL